MVLAYYLDTPYPVLIDAGVAESPSATILPSLRSFGIRLEDVRFVLATHGHWDHIGGAYAVKDLTRGASKVAIHEADAGLLADRGLHMQSYWGEASRYLDDADMLARDEAILFAHVSGELAADRELADGDRVHLGSGMYIEVVHTPGHTPGSVTYVLREASSTLAFSGDSVQVGGSSGSSHFPLYADPLAYRASVSRLLEDVRPTHLFLAHRFLADLAGVPLPAQLEGDAVRAALLASIDVERRIAAVVWDRRENLKVVDSMTALSSMATALGVGGTNPRAWSPALFITLGGYLESVRRGTVTRS